jgi:hypothetical protein
MSYGLGGMGLAGFGEGMKGDAMGALREAAAGENQRNLQNEQLAAQHEAGKTQLGASLGAMAGFAVGGPVGGVIGGVLGALGKDLF